jgi:uncharacterized protein (DUF4415 family)
MHDCNRGYVTTALTCSTSRFAGRRLQERGTDHLAFDRNLSYYAAMGNGIRGSNTSIASLSGVQKSYGAVRALEGVDLEIRSGEVLGLIGTAASRPRRRPIHSSPHERPQDVRRSNTTAPEESEMRSEYDFSRSVANPYVNKLKKQISIRIDNDTIEYFKTLAAQTAIPYQSLINLFLAECASKELKPSVLWQNEPRRGRKGRRPGRAAGRTRSDPVGGRR